MSDPIILEWPPIRAEWCDSNVEWNSISYDWFGDYIGALPPWLEKTAKATWNDMYVEWNSIMWGWTGEYLGPIEYYEDAGYFAHVKSQDTCFVRAESPVLFTGVDKTELFARF